MIDLDTISRSDGLLFVVTFVASALFLGWAGAVLERAWRPEKWR